MRYIKLFFLVLVFFIVMLFFVQNQSSFDEHVSLTLDIMFLPALTSEPIPIYALLVISFTLGALLVLGMLAWDRIMLSASCTNAKSKVNGLEKKISKLETSHKDTCDKASAKEKALEEELAKTKEELNTVSHRLEEFRKRYSQ